MGKGFGFFLAIGVVLAVSVQATSPRGDGVLDYNGNCPEACLLDIYRPVCGMKDDGVSKKTFTTQCDWELYNCQNSNQAYPKASMGACQ
ncbi:vasotab-like [Ischnura elegans]|uniref:vasotab-like n=1 Tax=Ischnura elegans TaxID=197161 RepID=UPI001ED8848C|nr:vasotab-like [Ischnura elegans]